MRTVALIAALLFTWAVALPAQTPPAGLTTQHIGGRDLLLYTPANLPAAGQRALVVVLHGGLGNAARIAGAQNGVQTERGLNFAAVADQGGFLVAYLNGTQVARALGPQFEGWNAGGGCCGLPAQNGVDDVAYITATVQTLVSRFGVDAARVYGIGHSNGAMMTTRLVCETRLYAAAISISGPLNLAVASCPAARGQRLLSIHGADDQNVPLGGGQGSKGLSHVAYQSEAHTQQVFTASGAEFRLQVVPGTDHALEHINAQIQQTEHVTVAQKAARYFGLLP
jgi:polyhydroxybutyrate depolymerase